MRVLPVSRFVDASLLLLTVLALGCVSPGKLDRTQFSAVSAAGGAAQPPAGSPPPTAAAGTPAPAVPPAPAPAAGAPAPAAGAGCAMACNIIMTRCGTCHTGGAGAQGMLDLVAPGLGTRIVNAKSASTMCSGMTLVDPQAPANSLLIKKLSDPPPCGLRMPIGQPLMPEEISCIQQWMVNPVCP